MVLPGLTPAAEKVATAVAVALAVGLPPAVAALLAVGLSPAAAAPLGGRGLPPAVLLVMADLQVEALARVARPARPARVGRPEPAASKHVRFFQVLRLERRLCPRRLSSRINEPS